MTRLPPAARCALLLPCLLLLAQAAPAAAQPRGFENLIGEVAESRDAGGVVSLLRGGFYGFPFPAFPDFEAPPEGAFAVGAEPGRDARVAPRLLTWEAADGGLVAEVVTVAGARRLDPASGRPLVPDAPPGATCATGAEPACQPGGAAPAANRAIFDVLCDATRGFNALDPLACPLDIYQSQSFAALPFASIAQLFSLILSGSPQGVTTLANPGFLGTAGRVPLVALSIDPADLAKNGSIAGGGPSGFFAPLALNPALGFALPSFAANHNQFQTLAQVLSPAQQALFGCGPLLGTACDGGANQVNAAPAAGGLDLVRTEAAAILQSFAPIGDAAFRTDDGSLPQPGTAGAPAPLCARETGPGATVTLAGCRVPGEPGFDPAVDGGVPAAVSLGFAAGIGPVPGLGSPALGPIAFTQGHPFTGQTWRSELAALSWNLQMLLVAVSTQVSTPGADPVAAFDPAAPYRTDGCSFVKPQLCEGVTALVGLLANLPPDDPRGLPVLRWIWERGSLARVASAHGRFARFHGGEVVDAGLVALEPRLGPPVVHGAILYEPDGGDVDGDGVANAADVCAQHPDAEQEDGDGVGDACDLCRDVPNPRQRDSDADGFGNLCDPDLDGSGFVDFGDVARMRQAFFGTDPDADLDGDGVVGFADLARLRAGFLQPPGPSALAP